MNKGGVSWVFSNNRYPELYNHLEEHLFSLGLEHQEWNVEIKFLPIAAFKEKDCKTLI